MPEKAVKVAVRVRIFNGREKDMNAKLGVNMSNSDDPDGPEPSYTMYWGDEAYDDPNDEATYNGQGVVQKTFDYSLWSHCRGCDGCPDRPDRPHIDQKALYDNIGQRLFNEFWGPNGDGDGGFDCCLFAYGQSGAGKSYSMTGAGPRCSEDQKGMIPKISAAIFKRVGELHQPGKSELKVVCTMAEIYLDKVYDLLLTKKEMSKPRSDRELTIMMGKPRGITEKAVSSVDDVADCLIQGFGNQTKAPTGLNPDSSRGHTIFTLLVTITSFGRKKGMVHKTSIEKSILLVDLAGSERADKVSGITKEQLASIYQKRFWVKENYPHDPPWPKFEDIDQDERDRLCASCNGSCGQKTPHHVPRVDDKEMAKYKADRGEEGTSINSSLTALGKIVGEVGKAAGIQDKKKRKRKMQQISWRSNKLTLLLKMALEGKCKTIMIAAVSPSTTENPETASTMRYADSIAKIPSTAVATVKIKSAEDKLKEELEAMKKALAEALANGTQGTSTTGMTAEEKEEAEAARREAEELRQQLQEAEEYKRMHSAGSKEYEARQRLLEQREADLKAEIDARNAERAAPHLLLLTQNPLTSGMFLSQIPAPGAGKLIAGQADEEKNGVTLKLRGTGVQPIHATFEQVSDGTFMCTPCEGAQVFINGDAVTDPLEIKHNDRLRLGTQNYFRFIYPAFQDTLSPDEVEADDNKYTYDFVKSESMSKLLATFEKEDTQKRARDEKLAEDLAERERQLAEANEKMKADAAAQKAKFEQDLLALQEKLKAEMAAGNSAREEQLRKQMESQQADLESKMAAQRAAMELKLKQEEDYKKILVDQHQAEEKARNAFRLQLHHDLIDCLPAVEQAKAWAEELGIPVTYACKVVMKKQPSGATFPVTIVQLQNSATGQVERWTMEDFKLQYGVMNAQYTQFKDLLDRGESFTLPWDSPFKVNIHSQQSIGTASVFLQYIYFNMDMSETFSIISGVTGGPAGTVSMSIQPRFATEAQLEAVELGADTLHDVPDLEYLDLDFNITRCNGLPATFASDVTIKFGFPTHVLSCVLPHGFDKSRKMTPEEVKKYGKRGAIHQTKVIERNVDILNVNPDIEYEETIRILSMDFRTREWFKNASLMLEVFGEPPNLELDSSASTVFEMKRAATEKKQKSNQSSGAPVSSGKVGSVMARLQESAEKKDYRGVNKATAELEQEVNRLAAAAESKMGEANALQERLEQAERRAKKAELREAERQKEMQQKEADLKRLQEQLNKDTPQMVRELQAQLKAAQEQAAAEKRRADNAQSSACSIS